MRIAFYAPLKSPDHPVPSGDRQMARMLVAALRCAGHEVEVASELRSFAPDPTSSAAAALREEARREIARLSQLWAGGSGPELWFAYHPYYKAPDWIGPPLARRFGIPYVTAEASYSPKRNVGPWAEAQAHLAASLHDATVNICFTARDRDGLAAAVPQARLAMLPPFIETAPYQALVPAPEASRLVTVAMMRPGDKMTSYRMLAAALERIADLPWMLTVVGAGPCRAEVTAAFAGLPAGRVEWLGERAPGDVAAILRRGALYVWPGFGEAYGIAYLEAQAAGLPVIAQAIAGVPEVVRNGETGFLTPPGDEAAFADAIAQLLTSEAERRSLSAAARRFVLAERSLERAAERLSDILSASLGART